MGMRPRAPTMRSTDILLSIRNGGGLTIPMMRRRLRVRDMGFSWLGIIAICNYVGEAAFLGPNQKFENRLTRAS